MALQVRASVDIPGSKGRIDGRIEVGLSYRPGEKPSELRAKLIQVIGPAAAWVAAFDDDDAAGLAMEIDERIGQRWARARFVEIWRGTGDDAEPLIRLDVTPI